MSEAAAQSFRPTLVMIHGWSMSPQVWGHFADALDEVFDVRSLALPGHGGAPDQPGWTAESLASQWLKEFPDALWLGWSLGAQVAMAAAEQASSRDENRETARVRGLILIGATPRFVAADDWDCAMAQKQFRTFKKQLAQSPGETLQQFLSLQVLGSQNLRLTLSQLLERQAETDAASRTSLLAGLEVLEHTDLRQALPAIECPVLWLCGEKDQLVPAQAARESDGKLQQSRVECVPGAGHAPFISHEAQVLDLISTWYSEEFS